MTAVNWLLQELEKVNYHPTEAMIMYAKKLEKQQIIDAFDEGQEYEYQYHINGAPKFDSETYFAETYGSKGSDESKLSIASLTDEQLKQKINKGNFSFSNIETTSSQTEISAVKYLSDAILSQKYNNDIFDLHNIIQNAFLIEKELINKQTEISDEEIEKWAYRYDENQVVSDYRNSSTYGDFIEGAKWYREQLKSRQ